ncbi:cation:dicarboxylate symporter family transporter [Sediminispirochaeta bajacaliforniensis]|uniref:cation:dicarboxylate symporter family transporter n=1 Tax=Sediminispirochaeta bajacaliforniensis TaxID=148 RepID=UPI00036EAB07|nr:cation:dicarboxylase symporter family transporter [Sediminispirochaeta bajacaliforniensis]
MKIWLKYLFAIILGTVAALFLPESFLAVLSSFLPKAIGIITRIGIYLFLPLLFFGLAYAVYKLQYERRFFPVLLKTLLVIVASGLLLTLVGVATVLLFSPDRIPVIIESEKAFSLPGAMDLLEAAFPPNLFSIFGGESPYLLSFIVLGLLLGFGFTFDRVLTRPAVQLFDSLSRIFFHLARLFVELLSIGMLFFAAGYTITMVSTPELALFSQLFLLLTVDTIIVLLGIYPLLIFLLTRERNPYRFLYGLTAPMLAAFLSGSDRFSYINLANHVKANLGIPRPVGAVTLPLFTLLGKAGTAMVSSVGFIVLLSSYSSLGIKFSEVVWIILFSFGASFLAASAPQAGVLTVIAMMCTHYGKGIEEAYLILLPALPILMSFSALIDTVTAGLGTVVVAKGESGTKEVQLKDFI